MRRSRLWRDAESSRGWWRRSPLDWSGSPGPPPRQRRVGTHRRRQPRRCAGRTAKPSGTQRALKSVAGFQALVDSVTQQVHAQYPNATLGDIVGYSLSGPTTSITDLTRWDFQFNDEVGKDQILVRGTVFLPSRTATITVVPHTVPLFNELTEPVGISPFKATLLIRNAGYRKPFTRVTYLHRKGAAYPHLTARALG
jgi:hypothetical protein